MIPNIHYTELLLVYFDTYTTSWVLKNTIKSRREWWWCWRLQELFKAPWRTLIYKSNLLSWCFYWLDFWEESDTTCRALRNEFFESCSLWLEEDSAEREIYSRWNLCQTKLDISHHSGRHLSMRRAQQVWVRLAIQSLDIDINIITRRLKRLSIRISVWRLGYYMLTISKKAS